MSSVAKVIKREWLYWPFFEPRHHGIGDALDRFVQSGALDKIDHSDIDGACRRLVRARAPVLACWPGGRAMQSIISSIVRDGLQVCIRVCHMAWLSCRSMLSMRVSTVPCCMHKRKRSYGVFIGWDSL